jgi:beta-glucanase (GH16 family)
MPGTWPYENDESDLGITHEYGEDTAADVISTFPGVDGGDGQPKTVIVRKPRP